jgi:ABC-type amino acid transport system permease subunit
MTVWQMLITLLFGYPLPSEMIDPRFPSFLQRAGGLSLSLLITLLSLLIGAGIGIALALSRRDFTNDPRVHPVNRLLKRTLHYVASVFVEGIRGLPIMLLVLLTFHLPYRLAGLRVPGVILALTAFSLYASVYFSEIARAGFRAVDPRLLQVGRVLGMTPTQVLLRIELPLVYRNMTPDVINLAVTVFKDSSTLAIVAVSEMTYVGRQLLTSQPMNYGLLMFLVLMLYWVPATILSAFAFRADRRRIKLGRATDIPTNLLQ